MRWKVFIAVGLVGLLGACNNVNVRKELALRASPKFPEGAEYVGSETCTGCHSDLASKFAKSNVHGKLADWETSQFGVKPGCESCHGPGSKHAESGDPSLIVNPAKMVSGVSSTLCTQCHRDSEVAMWHGSKHDLEGVSCSKCHTMHGETKERNTLGYRKSYTKEAYLKESEPELCFSCHKDIMAQTRMPNHHPVKEGKMTCSECHNPHGSTVDKLVRANIDKNEVCLKCHQEKGGPYVFEHAPVNEDCMICHNPHGSVANNLLKQNEPFICLQCHSMHFHAGFTPSWDFIPDCSTGKTADGFCKTGSDSAGYTLYYNGTALTTNPTFFGPGVASKFVRSNKESFSMAKAMNTKCTRCHSAIHGSDLPSLTVTGGGSRMTGGAKKIMK
ncbi:MAG: GSU2203 family decaheme c-type cytochrome [Thermoproteota archaeon]